MATHWGWRHSPRLSLSPRLETGFKVKVGTAFNSNFSFRFRFVFLSHFYRFYFLLFSPFPFPSPYWWLQDPLSGFNKLRRRLLLLFFNVVFKYHQTLETMKREQSSTGHNNYRSISIKRQMSLHSPPLLYLTPCPLPCCKLQLLSTSCSVEIIRSTAAITEALDSYIASRLHFGGVGSCLSNMLDGKNFNFPTAFICPASSRHRTISWLGNSSWSSSCKFALHLRNRATLSSWPHQQFIDIFMGIHSTSLLQRSLSRGFRTED